MKKLRLLTACLLPVLAAATAAAQAATTPTALAEALKKVSSRYARTEGRIKALVGRRLEPQPLPASLPNPFYRGVEPAELPTLVEPQAEPVIPAPPDISDADTLARLVPTLRITGLVTRNQQLHVTINSIGCKAGDFIPIPGKEHPVFIQVRRITNTDLTLGLNDAELTIPLKL
ncbi:MAG: hypothetical protein ACOZE5_17630 [Verrucomicrobiota bacterium]